uniref:Uncharacterized LOC103359679 n=1 Tax=Stegastes partitus TaxID=144197 RepID=A0A3B5B7H4_9TELE
MFLPGCLIWFILLTLHLSACVLETSEHGRPEVICSQGLSDCTVRDEMFLMAAENTVHVQTLKPYFKLCCKNRKTCTLCLEIDAELSIQPDKGSEDEGSSESDEEDYREETGTSATLCYSTAATMPTCKKVEFTVNHTALVQQNLAKVSLVITKPDGFHFGNQVDVYSFKQTRQRKKVVAPSLEKVCSQELRRRVPKCLVPAVSSVINQELDQVELQFEDRNKTLPSMCIQYEQDGKCQSWSRRTIPLQAVAPCMCLQAWNEDGQRSARSVQCPFKRTDFQHVFQKNMWENVFVSVMAREKTGFGTMLLWNLSAPCRLEGEVQLCYEGNSCRQKNEVRQQLANGTWRGFCFVLLAASRGRWSLLVAGVLLLVCLTMLMCYFLHHFVKIGRKGHVVLLSPPDVDDGVSESVHQLWSLLCSQGFSVSVDMWSRKEQCDLGPLPWLHSQLLKINSLGSRAVLILNGKALERTEEWTRSSKVVIETKGEDRLPPQLQSPYYDMFAASLFLIQADKQLGRAGERFVLVRFDSPSKQTHSSDRSLPELLQGLPLFQLPSQTPSLLAELTAVPWDTSDGGTLLTTPAQSITVEYLGVDINVETTSWSHDKHYSCSVLMKNTFI